MCFFGDLMISTITEPSMHGPNLSFSCFWVLLQMLHQWQKIENSKKVQDTIVFHNDLDVMIFCTEFGCRVRVLVCAPSNAALDELVARLMHRMLDKAGDFYTPVAGSLVRFGSKKLMHPDVQSVSLDQLSARLSTTSAEHSRSWVDILEGASIVCATLSGCGQSIFDELSRPFDVVIIGMSVEH